MAKKTSDSLIKAVDKYQKEKTDLIRFRVPKGKKQLYIEQASRRGFSSLTGYLISLLENDRDNK